MRTVSARAANQGFSTILAQAEAGEEVVITRRGTPVAVLRPFPDPADTPERQALVASVVAEIEAGLPLQARRFTRDEMHER